MNAPRLIVLAVILPVVILMSTTVAAAGLGWLLKSNVDDTFAGHELLELSQNTFEPPD